MNAIDFYREEFQRFLECNSTEPAWLLSIRKEAFSLFCNMGFPTKKTEEWKYTSLQKMEGIPFRFSAKKSADPTVRNDWTLEGAQCLQFSQGHEVGSNARFEDSNVIFGTVLQEIEKENPAVRQALEGQLQSVQNMPFAALNLAFFSNGFFLQVREGKELTTPFHVQFVQCQEEAPLVCHYLNIVEAQACSKAMIVESYVGDENQNFTNVVTRAKNGKNAFLDHYRIQEEGLHTHHIGHLEAFVERDGNFSNHSVQLGGLLVRNEIRSTFLSSNAECTLNGLYCPSQNQSMDTRTCIEHTQPHCNSFQVYKGILEENGVGSFNGKIHVHPQAQKTDAKQSNHALLLSDHASMNSKPQLEIYADDVKCTHGATSGQLDEEAMFYLKSRGIREKEAQGLLTYAFANEVIETFQNEELKKHLQMKVEPRFLGLS